jgi:putative transposase
LSGRDDALVLVRPVLDRIPNFGGLLESAEDEARTAALRAAETIGRPLGSET